MNTCKDCRFAVAVVEAVHGNNGIEKTSTTDGFCYRYPPTMVPPNSASYPPIALERFWCGELVVTLKAITTEAITRQATPTRKKGSRK